MQESLCSGHNAVVMRRGGKDHVIRERKLTTHVRTAIRGEICQSVFIVYLPDPTRPEARLAGAIVTNKPASRNSILHLATETTEGRRCQVASGSGE